MIDRLVSIRTASAEALAAARRAMASDDRWACRSLAAARRRLDEAALLATCERFELHGVARLAGPSVPTPRGCTRLHGIDAARHLLRVAAGLESRMVGETHILGQVAAAGRQAADLGCGGPLLAALFATAVRCGRRVRSETPLGQLAGSHVQAAVARVHDHLAGRLPSRGAATAAAPSNGTGSRTPPRCDAAPEGDRTAIVGILGGGAMAMEIADALGDARVVLFCRHVERARQVAGSLDAEIVPLATLADRVGELSALVAATTSPRALVAPRDLRGARQPLLVVDLGVPANIEPAVAELAQVTLLTLRDLAGPAHAESVIAAASAIVEQEVARFVRSVAPLDVILAAHGAGDESEANAMVHALARGVAARRPGATVRAALNLGTPRLDEVSAQKSMPRPLVIPVMTSQGWFVRERLPAMLGVGRSPAKLAPIITPPVGAARRLLRSVCDDAVRAVRFAPPGDVAVIVVGHGTSRSASSGNATRALADELRQRLAAELPDRSTTVRAAFLDEPPMLEDVAEATRSRPRIVLPWLIGGGDHALRDLGQRTSRPDDRHPTTFLDPLGGREDLLDAVLDLLDWHGPDRVLRLGTRGSALARHQAAMAADRLAAAGVATAIHVLDTAGDLDLARPIDEFPTDGPFSDALQQALVEGVIDVAVHSLKDLPLAGDRDTCVAAVLPRGAAGEALVTRDGRTLAELPAGARIGTCSARRAVQLAALRPDTRAVPIRGAVDARVAAVDGGEFDAVVLAEAGLERLGLTHRIAQRFRPDQMLCEAGQGAIVLTTRSDDLPAKRACEGVDDAPSRRAVEVERRIAQAIECGAVGANGAIAAVHADVLADGSLRVLARAMERFGGARRDASAIAASADEAVARIFAGLGRRGDGGNPTSPSTRGIIEDGAATKSGIDPASRPANRPRALEEVSA